MKGVVKIDVTARCLCGGEVSAGMNGALVHTLPTCADYDAVETMDDGAAFLARVREKIEREEKS